MVAITDTHLGRAGASSTRAEVKASSALPLGHLGSAARQRAS